MIPADNIEDLSAAQQTWNVPRSARTEEPRYLKLYQSRHHQGNRRGRRSPESEPLSWVMDDVDYIETVVRRERRGSSHGLSIRIARGVYYRPSAFRNRAIEWEESVHQDTGLSVSPPSTSTSQDSKRSSESGTTRSWTSTLRRRLPAS